MRRWVRMCTGVEAIGLTCAVGVTRPALQLSVAEPGRQRMGKPATALLRSGGDDPPGECSACTIQETRGKRGWRVCVSVCVHRRTVSHTETMPLQRMITQIFHLESQGIRERKDYRWVGCKGTAQSRRTVWLTVRLPFQVY